MKTSPFLRFLLVFILSCALFNDSLAQNSSFPVVNTTNGQVRGRLISLNSSYQEVNSGSPNVAFQVNAWFGIPYAEKPIGDLRFARPVPVKSWSGTVKDALAYPNQCPQTSFGSQLPQNEDCLYLNVMTPANIALKDSPVLVSTVITILKE